MFRGLHKEKTSLLIKEAFKSTILSCALLFIFSIAFVNISFFNPLKEALTDFDFLDVYYSENFSPNQSINKEIIIINIEQCSRFELALILEKLNLAKPKVIGFDVILKDKKDPETDSLLALQLNKKNIVTSFHYDQNILITNHQSLGLQNLEQGYINFNFDKSTSVVRDFEAISIIENKKKYLFSAKIAKLYLPSLNWDNWNYEKKLKTPQKINFFGNYNQFLVYDYIEFLKAENIDILKNKIVLLGYVGTPTGNPFDIEDQHFTPLNKVPSGKSIPDMHGVIIHANILNMLIHNDFLISIPQFWIIIITFITMFLSTLFFLKIKDVKPFRFINKKRNYLLVFSITSVGLMLWLFSKGIIFKVLPIIIATLFVSEYFEYYSHFVSYIKSKSSWPFTLFKKK